MQNPFEKTVKDPDNRVQIKSSTFVDDITSEFIRETAAEVEPLYDLQSRLEEFKQFLAGKSVAVVGRASYLKDLEQGSEIDSYDVVIRIHTWQIHGEPQEFKGTPEDEKNRISTRKYIPARYQKNIGSKTDVLYLRLQWINYSELSQVLELLKHDQTAWVGVETFAEMRDGAPRHHYIEQHFMPVHVIPIDFYGNLSARLNYSHPLPGTLIAAFLASTPASQIYITGCPCYQDKKGKTEHAKLQIMGQHQTITDFHYLRQLIRRDERFTCDPVMGSLFRAEVS